MNLLALIGLGRQTRGYPVVAYSPRKTPFQLARGIVPKAVVVVEREGGPGCQLIVRTQAEFARLYATV